MITEPTNSFVPHMAHYELYSLTYLLASSLTHSLINRAERDTTRKLPLDIPFEGASHYLAPDLLGSEPVSI